MSTATATMPNVDLGSEINKHRQQAQELEQIQQTLQQLQPRLGDHGLILTLMPAASNGKALTAIRHIDRKGTSDRKLGDILHEYFVKNPEPVTARDACKAAEIAGYQTGAKDGDLYGTVLSLFKQDKRFKKVHQRGSRFVKFKLAV